MSVTVLEVSAEMRSRIEPLLERVFEPADVGDLIFSRTCAHVVLESVRLLGEKQAQRSVLSSSTFVLTALLIGRRLADEGLSNDDADLGGELVRLRDWGLLMRDESGEAIDRLAADFFATIPVPSKDEFEYLPEDAAVAGVRPGPGLTKVVRSTAESGVLTAPNLVLQMIADERTGIAGRLKDEPRLIEAILRDSSPRGGRHTRMIREATADELALGVQDYAIALATVLRAAEEEFTFALFGPWGSGKTTLVRELKPLLRSPETYRDRTAAPVTDRYAARSYDVVLHNAWKYRSRPEAWVYAYKSLADRAVAGLGPVGRLLLSLRISAHRRGIWPIAAGLMTLALLAVPLAAKAQLAAFAVSLIGFSAFLYLGAVTTSVSGRVRALFAKHLRLSPVDERLGMLALIGEDVKALLCAWTARPAVRASNEDSGKDGDEKALRERTTDRLARDRVVVPIAAVGLVALAWAAGLVGQIWRRPIAAEAISGRSGALFPQSWANATAELFQAGALPPPSIGEWLVFMLWCLLAAAMLGLPWLARRGRPDRVLMVIDDLDRCSATEMLDVIESMKLLVDDSIINTRLQILMLVDESVLDHAIALRYAAMIDERASRLGGPTENGGAAARADAREEIVVEQHEKLFACHLRLAPLGDADVAAVVTSLASRELEEKRRERRERDLQRLRRQREAASEMLRTAEESARRAEEDYGKVEFAVPTELPDHLRVRTASGTLLPSDIELRYGHDSWASLPPEERLKRKPDVVRARDQAFKVKKAAEQRVRALSLVSVSADSARVNDPLFDRSDVRFTVMEVEELRRFVPAYLRSLGRRPSPRAVRILLFKIQLCRLLLQLRYPGQPPENRSIEAILAAFTTASDPGQGSANESETVAIARQVI